MNKTANTINHLWARYGRSGLAAGLLLFAPVIIAAGVKKWWSRKI